MEQRWPGTLRVWAEPFTPLRIPKLYNLRTDPFERADVTSNTYYDWSWRSSTHPWAAKVASGLGIKGNPSSLLPRPGGFGRSPPAVAA